MTQRLALARALVHDPALLLFDEPASALDPAGADWLATELAAERAAGRVVVLVTHDLAAAAVADQVVILRRGRVVFDETRAGGFGVEAVRAAYEAKTREKTREKSAGGDRCLTDPRRRLRPRSARPASSGRRCGSPPRIWPSSGAAARCWRR